MRDQVMKVLEVLYLDFKQYLGDEDIIVYEEDMPIEFIKWLINKIK